MPENNFQQKTDLLNTFIKSIHFSEPQTFRNVTVMPLFSNILNENQYLLLDEALKTGKFKIKEVSEGGSVPELSVINELESDVLLLDGDILVGAKQNRTINTTIIIGKGKEVVIPVSCVERGRWNYRTREFRSAGYQVDSDIRKMKAKTVSSSLKSSRGYRTDQSGIWDRVSYKMRLHNVYSGSDDLSEIYYSKEEQYRSYEEKFNYNKNQLGIAVFIGPILSGIDIFGVKDIMSKTFKKILRGYIFEGIERGYRSRIEEQVLEQEILKEKLSNFLGKITNLQKDVFKSVGEGFDIRFDTREITGYAIEHNDKIVHLAGFNFDETEMMYYNRRRMF